jgi:hypothetical protein
MTRLWIGRPKNYGSIPGRSKKFISFPERPVWPLGPPSFLFNGYLGLFLLSTAVGTKTEPLSSPSAGAESEWNYTPIHTFVLVTFPGTNLPSYIVKECRLFVWLYSQKRSLELENFDQKWFLNLNLFAFSKLQASLRYVIVLMLI